MDLLFLLGTGEGKGSWDSGYNYRGAFECNIRFVISNRIILRPLKFEVLSIVGGKDTPYDNPL